MDAEEARQNATEMARRLRDENPHARYELDWTSPLQLLVATILAGGSKDSSVNEVTPALFGRWPDAQALAAADLAQLEDALRPLGLAQQKAARLVTVCEQLAQRFAGRVPGSMAELLTLPGVQRKTANVVLTNAFGIASGIVVDVHVTRVAQRVGLSKKKQPEQIETDLMELLPAASWIHFGAATIVHGRHVCTAQAPRCGECQLADLCEKNGVTSEGVAPIEKLPRAKASAAKSVQHANAWPDELQVPAHLLAKKSPPASVTPPLAPSSVVIDERAGDAPKATSFPADWAAVLQDDLRRLDFSGLTQRVAEQRTNATVFPPPDEVFSAFHYTPFEQTRVIILGQDPYHGPGQGHGLAFSVKPGVKVPPSLANMYKELQADLGCTIPSSGYLVPWAKQGVLLLNTVLTVRSGEANSHKGLGWEELTDAVISSVSARAAHVVVVLWGNHARKKARLIAERHTRIEGAHPSPLSVKQFSGSRPFSKINDALRRHGQSEIDWQIRD